jgi:uncharacterized protein YpuA (DUF1002 family)
MFLKDNTNCIVCADEFNPDELQNVVLSKINFTNFKICQNCLEMSDPADDYKQAKDIINQYLSTAEAKNCFSEVKDILLSIKDIRPSE